MAYNDWKNFWWGSITGPRKAVEGVADALAAGSMAILQIPADLPWRHTMRSAVEEQFRSKYGASDIIVNFVDVADECAKDTDPGKFLLQRFATSSVYKGYREKSGVSIQDYMIRNGVLHNMIIWVKGLKKNQSAKWLSFCKSYSGGAIEDGLFVIELREDVQLPVSDLKSTKTVIFSDCVREYDVQQFNSFVLDEQDLYGDTWMQYISTLAASLCQTDAEVSELYLQNTDFENEEPLEGIKRIAEIPEFSRRGANPDSSHVLALWRAGDYATLDRRVWRAQVQTLFPLIEMERVKLVQSHFDEIADCLSSHIISQFGTQLTDPLDIELGTLVFLMTKHAEDGFWCINMPDQETRDTIYFLKECRNNLAHGNCCRHEQVCQLLSISQQQE